MIDSVFAGGLHVIEGGRKADRRSADDEARMEAIAICDEVIDFAERVSRKARAARVELVRLGTPDPLGAA